MQIPYRIRTEIQTVDHIWTDQAGYRKNLETVMREQRSRNIGSRTV